MTHLAFQLLEAASSIQLGELVAQMELAAHEAFIDLEKGIRVFRRSFDERPLRRFPAAVLDLAPATMKMVAQVPTT